jgi:hypothetical protein
LTKDGISPFVQLFKEGKAAAFAGSPAKAVLALKVNGSLIKNFLYQEWFSMAASRLGEKNDPTRTAVKYLMQPCDTKTTRGVNGGEWPTWSTWESGRDYQLRLPQAFKIPLEDLSALKDPSGEYHRNRILQTLNASPQGFCMDLFIQPYVSKADTPIEDSTVIWNWSKKQIADWQTDPLLVVATAGKNWLKAPRKMVDPIKVATISIKAPSGALFSHEHLEQCEDLSFNPWNRVPEAHRPMGIVQRMKRTVYNASRTTRFEINGVRNGSLEVYPGALDK